MNINPFSLTKPHYDSYDDFYKFFEVYPKEINEGVPVGVFPPIQPGLDEKQEISKEKQDSMEPR